MIKKIFVVLLFPCLAIAQKNEESFLIKGNIKGLKDSTLVFLLDGGTGNTIAQDYAIGGKFNLAGKIDEADLYQISFIGNKETVEVFMSNDKVTLDGDMASVRKSIIKGSSLHNDYTDYFKAFDPLKNQLNDIARKINGTPEGAERNKLMGDFEANKAKVIAEVNKFTTTKSASPVSSFVLYIVNPIFAGGISELEERYDKLKASAKKGIYARAIEKLVNDSKIGGIGSTAADFVQNDVNDKPVALSSLRGKYVLIDFWASWCRPCRMENPNVVAAYNLYKDKNFTVLGVSLDKEKSSWLQAIQDDHLTWTNVSDLQFWSNAAAQLYKVSSIPQNFLIDPNGKIIGKDLRGDALISKLKFLLK